MAKGKLRKLFTTAQIQDALSSNNNNCKKAAKELSKLVGVDISRQTVEYWRLHISNPNKNGTIPVGTSKIDRDIRENMVLRTPKLSDDDKLEAVEQTNERILIIPDLHAPYQHKDTLEFLIDVAAKIQPTRVISLGDETDGHAISFHDSDPNLDSAGVELEKAKLFLGKLARVFPVVDVCHSNHGSLIYRRTNKAGLPVQYIKTYRDVLFPNGEGDGWSWHEKISTVLPNGDKCIFQHQSSGDILSNAAHERANIIQGHEHGQFKIDYRSSSSALYWAMISGCLVDRESLAFAYGKLFPKKPIIGVSAIIDSQPVLIPMPLDSNGRYTGKLNGVFV
jgi:metallophosphoesterase superfamily enzyme